MKVYNKLVRDGVPDHIRSVGEPFTIHIASEQEFRQKLYEKLAEEAQEFGQGSGIGELADLLDVVDEVKKLNGWSSEEVEEARLKKFEKRGGFDRRIILEQS